MKGTVNAERKSLQKELDSVKNKQLGPKWNQALANVQTLQKLQAEKQEKEAALQELEEYKSSIQPVVEFLCHLGYLRHNDPSTLTQEDLGLKGLLATEVNEGHPILMTELYVEESLHHLSGEELVAVLSAFQEKKEEEQPSEIHVPGTVTHAIDRIFEPKIDRLYQRNNLATMPLRIATPNNHQYHLTPSAWWGDLPNSRATKAS
jgi:superfamily II RNA helicase